MSYEREPSKATLEAAVEAAVELAREVAPDLGILLLTHYADADTLDTLRPGETDLATTRAVNRAVAAEMIDQGVEILVQRANRAEFRRWMRDREDAPETRRAWIDRDRLLRGETALRLLGLEPDAAAAPGPAFGKAPGPIADRLLTAFIDGEADEVDDLAQDLLAAGRDDVLDLAIRKAAEHHGDQNADELAGALRSAAEGAAIGPSGWAVLVTLPVALAQAAPPRAAAFGQGLLASGALEETTELRFLPDWHSPEAVAALSPGALRRVLLDLVAGAGPRDLAPGSPDVLVRDGFAVLVGLQLDWDIPVWDAIAAEGGLAPEADDDDSPTPEQARADALFDRWRGRIFDESGGCVALALVPPSELRAEIAGFLDEAGTQSSGLEEIMAFVATGRVEAGEEEVVCRAEIVGDGLELSLYTAGGRFLGGLSLTADQLPARVVEMPRLLGNFVRLVKDAPGR